MRLRNHEPDAEDEPVEIATWSFSYFHDLYLLAFSMYHTTLNCTIVRSHALYVFNLAKFTIYISGTTSGHDIWLEAKHSLLCMSLASLLEACTGRIFQLVTPLQWHLTTHSHWTWAGTTKINNPTKNQSPKLLMLGAMYFLTRGSRYRVYLGKMVRVQYGTMTLSQMLDDTRFENWVTALMYGTVRLWAAARYGVTGWI